MTPDELDILIGDALLRDSFGAKEATNVEKRFATREWFRANLHTLRAAICSNATISKSLFGEDKQERNVLFGSLIDVVGKIHGWPVPVAGLAAKLIHYGLNELCAPDNLAQLK